MLGRFTQVAALGALLALFAASPVLAQDSSTINLGVGTQKVMTVPGTTRIALGDPSIAEVKVIGNNQILVIGQAEGKTTLLVWKSSGQRVSYLVTVRKQDPNEVISEIKKLLGEIEGVSVRMVGDRIYLDGQAYTSADAERIDQVVSLYPNVKSFVKVAPNAKKLVAQNLTAAFQKAGLRNVQVNVVGATIFLEGSVESQQDLQKAELITKAVGEKVENLLVVGIKRMILSEVQFVEIRRNGKDRYGIKYPTDITGSVTATANINQELFPSSFGSGSGLLTIGGGSE
ncbi:pilus assembly protein N-terminal domain-containing protein, partial [Archangium sp.]|uniref:pilus assembly protein N-terminal domain-containing protein n=1 Tax=Archangium sp. TaxID=1872627 RepID=UPI002ED9BF74